MKRPQCLLSLTFVGLILCAGAARANSINGIDLSVNSLSSCPGSFCFDWDPNASAVGFNLPNSGAFQLDAVNGGGFPPRYLVLTALQFFIYATGMDNTCASNIFASCSVTNHYHGGTLISFSSGEISRGSIFR